MRKILGLGLVSTMLIGNTMAFANITATSTNSTVYVDGIDTPFDAYNINNSNYFKIRDIAESVNGSSKQFEVSWDGDKNAINLLSRTPYTSTGTELLAGDGQTRTAVENPASIYKDGEEISLEAYNINGSTYFKLRDVCEFFDIEVGWDADNNAISVDTGSEGMPPMNGERPEGEMPPMDGERPEGEMPPMDGERPEGEMPPMDGERPEGEMPPMDGERPEGERPEGEPPVDGEMPEGGRPMMGEAPAELPAE